MKNAVFWDVAPCRYCVKRSFIPEDGIIHSRHIFSGFLAIYECTASGHLVYNYSILK
jgi:hypothetical protein